jgi:hypothetical protein
MTNRVRHLRRRSQEALGDIDGTIDLLFIDGAHRYGPARSDLEHWGARVAPGASMFVHDAFSSIGVTLALLRSVIGRPEWVYRGRTGSLAEYHRQPSPIRPRLGSTARQLGELPYFLRNVAVKALLLMRLRPVARLLGFRDGPWPY